MLFDVASVLADVLAIAPLIRGADQSDYLHQQTVADLIGLMSRLPAGHHSRYLAILIHKVREVAPVGPAAAAAVELQVMLLPSSQPAHETGPIGPLLAGPPPHAWPDELEYPPRTRSAGPT